MQPLEMVGLSALMERTRGRPETTIGLVDGPVLLGPAERAGGRVREVPGGGRSACARADSPACRHGTFMAGILVAQRSSAAPAICPGCTLLVRPIFPETEAGGGPVPSATPGELATAIVECIEAGARIINLSLAVSRPTCNGERALDEAIDHAVRRGVVVVAAAGNQGTLGGSAITRHAWTIPVVACDGRGRPMSEANLGSSIGRQGLSAPGEGIAGVGPDARSLDFRGTSVAAAVVTGAIALLWSEFPGTPAARIRLAITQASAPRRASVVPPLLNAAAAYRILSSASARRQIA
jgi:subtilisin family serine protease